MLFRVNQVALRQHRMLGYYKNMQVNLKTLGIGLGILLMYFTNFASLLFERKGLHGKAF